MAELSLTCPTTTAVAGGGAINVQRRILVRTGGPFGADTILDIITPGPGWDVSGDDVTFSGAVDFQEQTQVFRNGDLQLTGKSASDDNDVYFVAVSGSIAFETNIITNDVLQFWKFVATSG